MRNFRKQKIWQKGHSLVLKIYKMTRKFPREELYGIRSQMRRASVSIPANIAEGCGKKGDADFARFLQISMGSASELEYYLLLTDVTQITIKRLFCHCEAFFAEAIPQQSTVRGLLRRIRRLAMTNFDSF